jgi:hypothetical protein
MMGAGINGKGSSNCGDLDDDIYDGEVVSRVWKVIHDLIKLYRINLLF